MVCQLKLCFHFFRSSSKVFAATNAARHLRLECPKTGLPNATTGKHGKTPLGDLITIICSYDETQGYTSNGLSSYFHDLGWRIQIYEILKKWFPQYDQISLGGNYGAPSPSDLGFVMDTKCNAEKDPRTKVFENHLSPLIAAELLRRIVMFNDLPEASKWPAITYEDVQTLLYGPDESLLFPTGVTWGGMSTDLAIFVQSAVDIKKVESDAKGKWRIFSKLGAGYSSSRSKGEIVTNAYACWPVLDSQGRPIPDEGVEFVISVRGSVAQDSSLKKVEQAVAKTVFSIVKAVYDKLLY